jgi:hypothetical protein
MSAPTRVSQNGDTDRFTDTAEEPLAWFRFDQVMPPSVEARPQRRRYAATDLPTIR